jgi:hypothetical protein
MRKSYKNFGIWGKFKSSHWRPGNMHFTAGLIEVSRKVYPEHAPHPDHATTCAITSFEFRPIDDHRPAPNLKLADPRLAYTRENSYRPISRPAWRKDAVAFASPSSQQSVVPIWR